VLSLVPPLERWFGFETRGAFYLSAARFTLVWIFRMMDAVLVDEEERKHSSRKILKFFLRLFPGEIVVKDGVCVQRRVILGDEL